MIVASGGRAAQRFDGRPAPLCKSSAKLPSSFGPGSSSPARYLTQCSRSCSRDASVQPWQIRRDIRSLYPRAAPLQVLQATIIMPADDRSEEHWDEFLPPTLWRCSFGLGFTRVFLFFGGGGYVQMKCPTCFFVLCYRSIPHFSREHVPLVSSPKLPASAAAPASSQWRAQCPIKLPYPCGKESFLSFSPPPSLLHSLNPSLILPLRSQLPFSFSITRPRWKKTDAPEHNM